MATGSPLHTQQAIELVVTLADHPGIRASALQELFGVSRATLMRVIAEARHLGVVINYGIETGYRIESGDVKLARKWLALNQREAPLR